MMPTDNQGGVELICIRQGGVELICIRQKQFQVEIISKLINLPLQLLYPMLRDKRAGLSP